MYVCSTVHLYIYKVITEFELGFILIINKVIAFQVFQTLL